MGSIGVVGGDSNKFQHEPAARETQLSGSFADDISDIDADIDLTSPMPVPPSLSTRNEVNKLVFFFIFVLTQSELKKR